MVSEGYFAALGMTIQLRPRIRARGRGGERPRVALVNRAMADAYWPGESPLGKRIRATSMEPALTRESPPWITVIGVVNDVRHFGYTAEPRGEMFVLYRQLPPWRLNVLNVIARGDGPDDGALARACEQRSRERIP